MRDVRAIVTQRGAGCDGRLLRQAGFPARRKRGSVRRSRVVLAPRPWRLSTPPRGGVATVARKAVHRGEREVSRKTIARGKPGCFGCTCQTRVHSTATLRTRCCGRSRRSAFPAPSVRRRDTEYAEPGRKRVAGMRAYVLKLSSPGSPPSLKLRRPSEVVARRNLGGDGTGRPGIPETSVIESRSRGVLDAPHAPGHDNLQRGSNSALPTPSPAAARGKRR